MRRHPCVKKSLIFATLLTFVCLGIADVASAQLFRRGTILRRCRSVAKCRTLCTPTCTPCESKTVLSCGEGYYCPTESLGKVLSPGGICQFEIYLASDCGGGEDTIIYHTCDQAITGCGGGSCGTRCLANDIAGELPTYAAATDKSVVRKPVKFDKRYTNKDFGSGMRVEMESLSEGTSYIVDASMQGNPVKLLLRTFTGGGGTVVAIGYLIDAELPASKVITEIRQLPSMGGGQSKACSIEIEDVDYPFLVFSPRRIQM